MLPKNNTSVFGNSQTINSNTTTKAANSTQNLRPQDPDNTSIRSLSFKQREDLIKQIYAEILGKKPTYKEIDQFAYKNITPNQIRIELIKSAEFKQILEKAKEHSVLKQKIEMLKNELKQVLWIVKSLQEQIKAKVDLLNIKKIEIRKLRQFIRDLSQQYPEGPSSFFCTIYKTEYNQFIVQNPNTQSNQNNQNKLHSSSNHLSTKKKKHK